MKLSFPNPSRSFDPAKNRVQFWGYFQSVEITFFVDAAILMKLRPDSENNQSDLLATFDANADKIRAAADSEYVRSGTRAASYSLKLDAF